MKNGKIFLVLLLILTLLTFAACAGDDNVTPEVPDVTDDENRLDGEDDGGGISGGEPDDNEITTDGGIVD